MQFTLALAVFGASVALALPIAQLPSLPGGGIPSLPGGGGTSAITSLLKTAGAGALPGIPRGLPSVPGGGTGAITSLLKVVGGGLPTGHLAGVPRGLSTDSLTPVVEPLVDAGSSQTSKTSTHGNQIL